MKKQLLFGAFLLGSLFTAKAQIYTGTFNDTASLTGWNIIDADGDANNWGVYNTSANSVTWGLEGNFAGSASWTQAAGPLTPDNYIMSPVIAIPATGNHIVTFKAGANYYSAADGAGEQLSVYIATTAAPTLAELQALTPVYNEIFDDPTNIAVAVTKTVNLSAYAGQSIRVVFRHHESSNQSIVFLDDVVVEEGVMGTKDAATAQFSVFPNPATNLINVASANAVVNAVSIIDLNGRTVKTANFDGVSEAQVNISDLSSGVYMMSVASDKGTTTKKIVKN